MAVIVIDAGHGGTAKVGGSSPNNASSPSGLLEKDLTLAVARHAQTALAGRGHTVRLTRTTDVNLGLAARAKVAKAAQADIFVSIHFNGFSDPTVQGTETWVHQSSSARSRDLAGCVQRGVLRATGHRDRGVQAKVLGVLDAANHAPRTAACLAELSFITTTAEDLRLHDPAYLQALGEGAAEGIQEFVDRPAAGAAAAAATRAPRLTRSPVDPEGRDPIEVPLHEFHRAVLAMTDVLEALTQQDAAVIGAGRSRATDGAAASAPRVIGAPRVMPGSRGLAAAIPEAVSAGAAAVATKNPVLVDVRKALDAVPKKGGAKAQYAGPVKSDGDGDSHLQGLAGYKDFFLLTHSDKSQAAGRILVVDRRPAERKLVTEFRLPALAAAGPPLNHAGGTQIIGDVLAVPCESGENSSVVAFFDVSDPLHIRELAPSLRIARNDRDAAAAGITTITRNGQEMWLCAVYDSGSVDFYESSDLPGGAPFQPVFAAPIKVKEKDHQALLLFTDTANRVFAAGLNRGNFPFFDRLVLYEVDLVGQTMAPDKERSYSTGGVTRLRWGSSVELVGDGFALHCTERNYGKNCDIRTFGPALVAAVSTAAGGRARRARTSSRKTVAGKKTAKQRPTGPRKRKRPPAK